MQRRASKETVFECVIAFFLVWVLAIYGEWILGVV